MKRTLLLQVLLTVGLTGCSNALSESYSFKAMNEVTQDANVSQGDNIPNLPMPPAGGPRPDKEKHQSVELTGKVTAFTTNQDKAYDAFTLSVEGQTKNVKFPPHMAKQIMDSVSVDSTVTISGHTHKNPEGVEEVHFEKILIGTKEISHDKPGLKLPKLSETEGSAEGNIKEFRKGPKGDINGMFLSDGTLVHMPPKESENIVKNIKVGDTVKVTGSLKATDEEGFVYSEKIKIIRAKSINLNGQDYSLQK